MVVMTVVLKVGTMAAMWADLTVVVRAVMLADVMVVLMA